MKTKVSIKKRTPDCKIVRRKGRLFVINKKNNELRYNAGQTYEADRIIKELPETLEAHKSREIVIMSLEIETCLQKY